LTVEKTIRTKHGQFAESRHTYHSRQSGNSPKKWEKFGEPCWIRTSDPLLKRQMLYRLS
jgi:hypothetical protein